MLSQEEIDALLNDTFPSGKNESEEAIPSQDLLSDMEKDALGEIANISMGTSATTLSSLLGKKVEITTPQITITTIRELRDKYPKPYVIVDVNYNEGLVGSNALIIHTYDAGVIVDLMMGGDGSNPPLELNDLHLSAISEAMNQMMGSSCTSLSTMLNKRIDISPPSLDLLELSQREILANEAEPIIRISFRVVIQGLVDSEMMQLLPVQFAKDLVSEIFKKTEISVAQPVKKKATETSPPKKAEPTKAEPIRAESYPTMPDIPHHTSAPQHQIPVSMASFESLYEEPVQIGIPSNLNIIMDVGLQLSVELGRTVKKVKDILELTTGSIVELDKLAGEPVDVLVNGKLLAKGEVVIIDENFGVRVTEILSPSERVKNLK